MKREKPFKSITALVEILRGRMLDLDLESGAEKFLYDFNYYRFTGYARQWQLNPAHGVDQFQDGTTLSGILDVIERDSRMRRVLGDGLRTIELSVRARFAHELGAAHGETAFYLNPDSYLPIMPRMNEFLEGLERDMRRSKSPTIARYTAESGSLEDVPIWVAVEVMSFGSIAKMLQYLKDDNPARVVASSYSVKWAGFQSTIHSLAVLRNVCAHHAQIWHRKLDIQCPTNKKQRPRGIEFDPQGPYAAIIAMKELLKSISGNHGWADEVDAHLASSSTYASGIYRPFAK